MTTKHILLVTHDANLQATRKALLEREGYRVDPVGTDGDALSHLRKHRYDLIVIGRDSRGAEMPLDERIAKTGNGVPVVKIDDAKSRYSQAVGTGPVVVLSAVRNALSGRC